MELNRVSKLINLGSSIDTIKNFTRLVHEFSIQSFERKLEKHEKDFNLKILTKLLKKFSKMKVNEFNPHIYHLLLALCKSTSVQLLDFSVDKLYYKESHLWSIILQSISSLLYKFRDLIHIDYLMEPLILMIQSSNDLTMMKWILEFFFSKNYEKEKTKALFESFDSNKLLQKLIFDLKFHYILSLDEIKNDEILFYLHHILGTCSLENLSKISKETTDILILKCLNGMKSSHREFKKESIQLLYLYSQEMEFQQSIIEKSNQIYKIIADILDRGDFIIQYFMLKVINEWFDEAKDHFIVTESVSVIIKKFLKENLLLNRILPLCDSKKTYVKDISCEIFSNLSTSLSSTSDDIHFYLEYIKENVFKPFIEYNDNKSLPVLMNLLSIKQLTIPLLESGMIKLIENNDNLKLNFDPKKILEENNRLKMLEYKNFKLIK